MSTPNKDTIYIDIDEEITGIIDKVRSSSGRVIALVLPKRASVLQSIVNMKLLKRSADEAKKHLVLITSEAGLLPLAGAVGLHVAKTPQSKPEIPVPPSADDSIEETIDEDASESFSTAAAASRPIGELAGLATATPISGDEMETLQLDDDEDAALAASTAVLAADGAAAGKTKKLKKNAKLAVPNFERFRLVLVLGIVGVIALIAGLYWALVVAPKAVIAITTNASDVNVGLDLTLNTAAKIIDPATATIPAKLEQQQKSYTQTAPASGAKNNGNRATGSAIFFNCNVDDLKYGQIQTVPAGTGVSSNGLTYITQKSVDVPPSNFKKDGSCNKNAASSPVAIVAQTGGANYNVDDHTALSVAYANPSDGSKSFSAAAAGSISGGTDSNVKVVSQADIDSAKQKIAAGDSTIKIDLRKQLEQDGLQAIIATYTIGTPSVTSSAEAGAVADNVTVTETITYAMFGVKQADLKTLVDDSVKKQIDTAKQSILSEGLAEASYKVSNANDNSATITFATVALAGPDLKVDDLKTQVAGKKGGDIKSLLRANPGVTDVQIKLSPFWVTSVPKKASKITITVAKPIVAIPANDSKH